MALFERDPREGKHMRKWIKKLTAGLLAGILAVSIPVPAMAVERTAGNSGIVTLQTNRTYNSFDVTGDGKADKITLKSAYYDYYHTGKQGYLKIYINGKQVYNFTDPYYKGDATYKYQVKLCTLNPKDTFFFVRTQSETEYYNFCKIYKVEGGKFKAMLNLKKTYKDLFLHRERMELTGVSGDRLQFTWYGQMGAAGALNWKTTYELRNGKLYRISRTCPLVKSDQTREFTADKQFSVYKTSALKEKVFTAKKGDKLKITHVYNNSKYMFVRVVSKSGKAGWLPCPNNHSPYFKEAIYAG